VLAASLVGCHEGSDPDALTTFSERSRLAETGKYHGTFESSLEHPDIDEADAESGTVDLFKDGSRFRIEYRDSSGANIQATRTNDSEVTICAVRDEGVCETANVDDGFPFFLAIFLQGVTPSQLITTGERPNDVKQVEVARRIGECFFFEKTDIDESEYEICLGEKGELLRHRTEDRGVVLSFELTGFSDGVKDDDLVIPYKVDD
jgi:hypothetical protein